MSRIEHTLDAIFNYIDTHFAKEQITTSFLANKFGVDKYHLSREINKRVGRLDIYIQKLRVNLAKQLAAKHATLKEACFESGFGSLSQFTRAFKKHTGQHYSEYRKIIVQGGNVLVILDKIKYHLEQINVELSKLTAT